MSRLESSVGLSGSTSPHLPGSPQVGGGETPTSRRRSSTEDSQNGAEPGFAQEHQRTYSSDREEGYPSWLPKRPPPPAPASTFHSSSVMPEGFDLGVDDRTPSDSINRADYYGVGRRPTPRSVRIVSVGTEHSQTQKGRQRNPTDQSRASYGPHARVWSRGTAMSPTVISTGSALQSRPVRPRFNAPALHLELLTSPSPWTRLRFYLYPLFVFAHIPLQTFFDFNAVFILVQVSKFPTPSAPGVPGSGRGWALGAAAYIACWLAWILLVFVIYELIYSFYRRWRVKRPLMAPLYLSSPAFKFVCMTSFTNFCFMQYIRRSARPQLPFKVFRPTSSSSTIQSRPMSPSPTPPNRPLASWRDYVAETCYYYAQNVPTVALLLPRAGLALSLLLAFSTPVSTDVTLSTSTVQNRDGTFFRTDGTLTDYARGVLITNAAWTAWRVLLLLLSWIGLWILSGQACAGLCGPRYRWEEDDAEKSLSVLSGGNDDLADGIVWFWKECTLLRIQEAYEFCLTLRPPQLRDEKVRKEEDQETNTPYDGLDRVLAAAGFPNGPLPARRGVLSQDLFESPPEQLPQELSDIIPPVAESSTAGATLAGSFGPLKSLPYPFQGYPAQVSSSDEPRIPFPPSPTREITVANDEKEDDEGDEEEEEGDEEREDEEEEEEEDEEEEEEEEDQEEDGDEGEEEPEVEEEEEGEVFIEEPSQSSGKGSNSLSSLGHPVPSRYPFQFRQRPARTSRGGRSSVGTAQSKSSSSRQTDSTPSRVSQSTGNRESSDSPWSHRESSSGIPSPPGPASPSSPLSPSSPIPMPPRRATRRRHRSSVSSLPPWQSPASVVFPAQLETRIRTESASTTASRTFGPQPMYEWSGEEDEGDAVGGENDEPEPEGSQEAAEREDSVGLLSQAPSPRSSLSALRASNISLRRGRHNSHSGSASGSGSKSRSSSNSRSARSRAQSLIQSIAAASHSSLSFDIRSRTNSLARLDESVEHRNASSGASSQGGLSSPEDHTFGHPMRSLREGQEDEKRLSDSGNLSEATDAPPAAPVVRSSQSIISTAAPSEYSQHTVHPSPVPVPPGSSPSRLSSAPESFVTAAATLDEGSETTGQTPSSYGEMVHYVNQETHWRPA